MSFSCLSIINNTTLDTYVAWNQAPHVCGGGGGTQKTGSNSPAVAWGGERAAKPGDMPLMPSFHNTRFWYHALIGEMSSCWQIRGAVDSIGLISISHSYNLGKDFLKHGFRASNTNSFPGLFAYPSASRRAKNIPVICCKKKKEAFKIWSFSYTLLW